MTRTSAGPPSSPSADPHRRRGLPAAALVVGVTVVCLTASTQFGTPLLGVVAGLFGGDFLNVALLGLIGAGFCGGAAALSPGRRGVCLIGLALSLLPFLLLVYYLSVSEG